MVTNIKSYYNGNQYKRLLQWLPILKVITMVTNIKGYYNGYQYKRLLQWLPI